MILWRLFVCMTCLPTLFAQSCRDQGISNHAIYRAGRYRLSSLARGNFTIQGLISVTDDDVVVVVDNDGGSEDTNKQMTCGVVTRIGLLRAYAMKYVTYRVNKDSKLIPYATIGLQIDNVCKSLPVAMSRGMEIISQHRPHSVCRADFLKCDSTQVSEADVKPAVGIIGTGLSFSAIPLASLMSLYTIPLVSYAASSKVLSNKNTYPSFFRTMPSDTNQINAIFDVIKAFRWNYVIAIASDDDYGRLSISDFKKNAKSRDICIIHDTYIPYRSAKTQAMINDVLNVLQKNNNAEVIILFCYVNGLGNMILEEANRRGMNRVWLTSDVWNPGALSLPLSLSNQSVGILSISIKSYPMNYLLKYIKKEITNNWKCDMWLQKYMIARWNCKPENISGDRMLLLGKSCNVSISEIMKELSLIPGEIYNLVNSATAMVHGIHRYLQQHCTSPDCFLSTIPPDELTALMYNVNFTNEEGNEISFDKNGDPKFALYTIENLQIVDGKYSYLKVGNWTNKGGTDRLMIDKDRIKWPLWFRNTSLHKHPFSRCNPDCEHGEYVINKRGCCWDCAKCFGNNYTDTRNALNCSDCGLYYHTLDNKKCILTDVKWTTIENAPGLAMLIISVVGFVIAAIASLTLLRCWKVAIIGDNTPHLTTLYCFMLLISYAYGVFQVIEPSQHICSAMSAIFYLMLMMYTAVLMVQTRFWNIYLMEGVTKFLKGNTFRCQMISLLGYLLIEGASVTAWLVNEGDQVLAYKDNSPGVFLVWKQCRVETTAARYISTFIPVIILIVTTFCAFRERNGEHCFHEPKFRSFSCIALCIVVVAYLPTFQFVDGKNKSIIMAIVVNVLGCTFLVCLTLPKIYVGIMRTKRGSSLYPLRPGTERKEEPDANEKPKNNNTPSPSFASETRDTRTSMTSLPDVNKDDESSKEMISVMESDGNIHASQGKINEAHDNEILSKESS